MHTYVAETKTNDASTMVDPDAPLFDRRFWIPFWMVTALFFLWALPNNLNDVLIRQFMKSFQLSRLQGGLVQSAFYLGYFCVSVPAALVLRRFGYRIGLIAGLVLYAAGCLLFWPAAVVNQYSYFLVALFIIAAGLAFLETGAGSFIAQLGEPETAARRLNLAQSFNPPGTIAGALIGTVFIFSGIEKTPAQVTAMQLAGTYASYLHQETLRVAAPYLILGALVLIFAAVLWRVEFPSSTLSQIHYPEERRGNVLELLRMRHFSGAVVSQFFYIGAQVGTWSFLISYVQEYARQSEKTAGYFLSGTLLIFAVGRFISTFLMKYIAAETLMGIYAVINIALVAVAIWLPGWAGIWALMVSSFFMSSMYPTNFALGVRELGPNTTLGASVLVMSIVGGAAAAPVMGWVAERQGGMASGFLVTLLCYVVVGWYAFFGCRIRRSA